MPISIRQYIREKTEHIPADKVEILKRLATRRKGFKEMKVEEEPGGTYSITTVLDKK